MSLGVLNNLNAIYAENNLNNTNNSLSTVLQQLSSGSRINSGADDAAGLSLVDGLQANSVALTQSKTNATEGVGLLTVADGALSQVTNLLNRAVTLATEASNGTLNSSQDTAANQEYQSILSEISNIGSTTTYNDEQVFNSKTNIYTGDSSALGSSIDALNIGSLSSSNVGDTNGVMAYSNGTNNVFLNLSSATSNAQATDTLNTSGATTLQVNYLVKGADGSENTATTTISVGGTSGYANTANGLIGAINNAGLGLTASFTTQTAAGVTGGGTQTGIQITGGLVSAGIDPNTSSTGGTVDIGGVNADELLTQGQSITLQSGTNAAVTIAITSAVDSLATLASAINGADAAVKATVITNGDGTQSLNLEGAAGSGALNVTTSSLTSAPIALGFTAGSTGATGGNASGILGFGSSMQSSSSNIVSGTVVLSNAGTPGANAITFVMGTGAASGTIAGTSSGGGSTFTVNGDTLGNLSTAIASQLGVTTSVGTGGITMTSTTSGTTLEQVGASSLTATPSVGQTGNVAGAVASNGSDGTTTISMSNSGTFVGADALTGNIVLQNGAGLAQTFVMGSAAAVNSPTNFTTGAETVNGLVTSINANSGSNGISAALSNGQIVLTSTTVGTAISMNSSTLVQTSDAIAGTVVDVTTAGTSSITLNNATNGDLDTMAGSIVLSNASSTGIGVGNYTFVMGTANTAAGTGAAGTYVTAAATMASLATKIAAVETASTDPAGINLTASDTTGTLTLTSKTALAAGNLTLSADTLTDTANQIVGTNATTTATFAVGGQAAASSASNGISGSIVLADTAHTDTFIVGSGTNAGTVFYTGNTEADETMAGLAAAITAAHGVNSDFTVTSDGAAGLILGDSGATNITTSTSTLINQTNSMTGVIDAKLPSAAVASTGAGVDTSATAIDSSQLTATGDTITGTVVISSSTANTATQGSVTDTFVMGAGTASAVSAAGTNANTFSITGTTLNDLINEINLSGTALAVTGGGAQADHNMEVTATLNAAGSGLTLTDTTSGANLGTSITVTSSALSDASTLSFTTPAGGDDVENSTGVIALTDGGALALSGAGTGQTLSGSVVVTNGTGLSAVSDTFVMGQSSATSTYAVGGGTFNITGSTVAALATAINAEGIDAAHSGEADLNLTASVDAQTGGVFVQSSYPGVSGLTANTTGLTMTLTENASQGTNGAAGATTAPAEAQFSNGGINSQGDPIAGSVVLANVHSGSTYGLGGGAVTFVVGAGTDSNTTYYTGGTAADETMGGLANAINLANSNLTLALSATASATGLTVVSTDNTSVINFGGGTNTLVDQYGALQGTQVTGGAAQGATHATAAVGTSGQIGASDALSGSITLDNGGTTQTFIIGSTYNNLTPNTITTGGTNIQDLATAINDDLGLGVGATVVNGVLQLQANSTATSITVGTGTADTLIDTVTSTAVTTNTGAPGGLSSASLKLAGGLTTANSNDSVSGSITLTGSGGTKTFVVGGTTSGSVVGVGNTSSGETLGNLAAEITAAGIGITAGVGTAGLTLTGSTDNPTAITTSGLNTLKDTTTTAALSYTAASPYNVGISNSTLGSGQSLYDSSTGQAANGTMVDFVTNDSGGGGIATISYSDSAGQSLNSTDLSNQTDAQAALLDLNHAITDVAAQDGYIGAQINTLNAVSQVLATQQENVVSAQNAVQATDYASATSNMSKYEILSQTGISALAQANSLQQEVTKLLQ